MSKFLFLSAIVAVILIVPSPAQAQDDTCEMICDPTIDCQTECNDPNNGGSLTTCGQWGSCDPDPDNDGLWYWSDNCPYTYNPGQEDCDGDGTGDVCDIENGDFYAVSIHPCFIRSRLHAGYYEQNRYWEGLYRDRSACNSPDEYRFEAEETAYCFNYNEFDCCMNLWGDYWQCSNILDNNQCSY